LSVGAFESPYLENVIAVFMVLFGINFAVFFAAITRRFVQILKNTELKVFIAIIAASTGLITLNLFLEGGYESIRAALRHAFFQVSSLISTTGYSTTDFNVWPDFSRGILFILMVIGACAASTAGGLKIARVVILFKSAVRELKKILHPNSVNLVFLSGRSVPDGILAGVMHFFVVYVIIAVFATLLILINNLGLVTSFSAVIATLSNVGPGFERVGPMGNYACFSMLSKGVLILCMLLGRLEIFPILLLFLPASWRKVS